MATLTLKGQEAREKLIKGVNELSDIVTITLGPLGRNVAIDRRWNTPQVIHDGATAAKAIHPKDSFEAMGAEMVKEAALKTADSAGDGTTTATLLAQAIINAGDKAIKNGANPMLLKEGIEEAVKILTKEIKNGAKTLKNKAEITQIATISSASAEIGNLIAEALEKVGRTGVVTVEPGQGIKTEVTYKEGMEFDKGFESTSFITNKDKSICEIENPYILLADFAISSPDELAGFLKRFLDETKAKNIVFITDGIEGAAKTTLIVNGRGYRDTILTVSILAPGIGQKRKDILEDIAILTGAQAGFSEHGVTIENFPVTALGRADKVHVTESSTQIIGGRGDASLLQQRIASLKDLIKNEKSAFEKEKLQERLAKLTGGAAIIQVGGTTEIEIGDTKERVIDAVSATKAAVEEGIVAGGGVTLLKIRENLLAYYRNVPEDDKTIGMSLVYNALEKPVKKLLENAGIKKGAELPIDGKTGYNVITRQMVNMFDAGIIDPAKVTRQAIQNAASVAAMILTCEAAITEVVEDKKSPLEMPQ